MTVAPPARSLAATAPAIEPGAAPVMTATCPEKAPGVASAAARAMASRRSACSGRRLACQRACRATSSPTPSKLPSTSYPAAMRATSSRALAHRSFRRTARSGSKAGLTNDSQPSPSSADTAWRRARSSPSGVSAAGCSLPRRARRVRADSASASVRWPVTAWRAAGSTAPPLEPAEGLARATPRRAATWATASSIIASNFFDGAIVARSPPRIDLPSRLPRTSATLTCVAQPGPRPHAEER